MDPFIAARVRKPRRTNSTPGNPHRAVYNRSLPAALSVALFAKRGEIVPLNLSKRQLVRAATVSSDAAAAAASDASDAPVTTVAVGDVVPPTTSPLIQDEDVQDILNQMNDDTTPLIHADDDKENDEAKEVEEDVPEKTAEHVSEEEEEEEFDVDETRYYFNKLRDSTGYCSEKISQFVQELWEELGQPETGMLLLGREAMAAPAVTTARKRRLFGEKEPDLHQRVLGVLNKVTDDKSKYREIKNELMRLPLPEADPASLDQVIRVFFAKAVREQRFSSHYADLVEEICKMQQATVGDKKESLSYRLRVALLCRCQEEFSHHRSLSSLPTSDPETGRHYNAEEIENQRVTEKRKLCGNVKFVGELFLRKIVSARIVQLILVKLLCGSDRIAALLEFHTPPEYIPEEYDCDQVITLLMTTGEVFSKTEVGVQTLDGVMRIVDYFSRCHPVQRTRFLLLDLLDAASRRFAKKQHGDPRTNLPSQPTTTSSLSPPPPPPSHSSFQAPAPTVAASSHYGDQKFSSASHAAVSVARNVAAPPERLSAPFTVARRPASLEAQTATSTSAREPVAPTNSKAAPPQLQPASPKDRAPPPPNSSGPATPNSSSGKTSNGISLPAPRSSTSGSNSGSPISAQARPRSDAATPPPPPVGPSSQQSRTTSSPPPAPVASVSPTAPPPAVSHAPITLEMVVPMINKLLSTSDFRAVAADIVALQNVRSVLDFWIQRSLGIVRAEQERYQIAPLLESLCRDHGVPKEELRAVTLHAFVQCVNSQLHEGGFRLWKYWAQIIAGDKKGVIVDDNIHNDAFQEVLKRTSSDGTSRGIDKSTARKFILDILSVEQTTFPQATSRFVSEECHYSRFRPLNVLTNFNLATSKIPDLVLSVITDAALDKLKDVELATYCSILNGKPNRDDLRTLYRMEDKMRHVLTPAKVLSAIYHAEYAAAHRSYLEENIDLLSFVIDHAQRNLRELALVLELYYASKGITSVTRTMNEGQRWISRLKANAVVTLETHSKAHELLRGDRDAELAIGVVVDARLTQAVGGGANSFTPPAVRSIQHR